MFQKLTPNIMVRDMGESLDFYVNVMQFKCMVTIPDNPPFKWALLAADSVEVMIQERDFMLSEHPDFEDRGPGAFTLYIEMTNIRPYYEKVKDHVQIKRELTDTFYGMLEFSILDPSGNTLTFAQRT